MTGAERCYAAVRLGPLTIEAVATSVWLLGAALSVVRLGYLTTQEEMFVPLDGLRRASKPLIRMFLNLAASAEFPNKRG